MGMPITTTMPATIVCGPPNVCKTPPFAIPVPMPSITLSAMSNPLTQAITVLVVGCPSSVMATMAMTLPADAAGVMLGNTGTIIGPSLVEIGATRVLYEGRPVATLTSMDGMNTENTVGYHVSPSQPMVLACP